jgi:hypothetical protein
VAKIAVGVCLGLLLTAAVVVAMVSAGSASEGDSVAEDRMAQSQARNLVSFIESCFTSTQDYRSCDEKDLADGPPEGELGGDEGQAEVESASRGAYTVVAHSESGNSFSVEKQGFDLRRVCTTAGQGACPATGTW